MRRSSASLKLGIPAREEGEGEISFFMRRGSAPISGTPSTCVPTSGGVLSQGNKGKGTKASLSVPSIAFVAPHRRSGSTIPNETA